MTVPRCCAVLALMWMADVTPASAQCSYNVSPTTFNVDSTASTRTLTVISGTACSWTASSTVSWLTVSNGGTGSGIGSVTFAIAQNPLSTSRSGTLTVAGQTVTVTQESGSCSVSVTPASFTVDATASSRTLSVISGTQCSWSAATTATWLTVTSGASGTGVGAVTFSIAANPGAAGRVDTLSVGGQAVEISQAGITGGTVPTPPANVRIVR